MTVVELFRCAVTAVATVVCPTCGAHPAKFCVGAHEILDTHLSRVVLVVRAEERKR